VREVHVGAHRVAPAGPCRLQAESSRGWAVRASDAPGDGTTEDTMRTIQFLLLAAGATLAFSTLAADLRPGGVFLAAGGGDRAVRSASIGLAWPWSWHYATASGAWSGSTEAYLGRWSAKVDGGRADFDQVGVVPLLRYRGAHGGSPWFAEGGIGLIYMNRLFTTPAKRFSTRLNFADTLGLGRSFGGRRQHEVSLRLTHFSNGGVKHPNPGQNVVGLKYAYLF
jgi:lipid A 3-O-deacylase